MAITALAHEAQHGGAEAFRERVLEGSAEFSGNVNAKRRSFIRTAASDTYIDAFIADLENNGVTAITKANELYPSLLRTIDDPPYVLYAIGNCVGRPIENPFAIVGTRRCTDYGRKVASLIGKTLAQRGVTVISGLAYGCDSYAHEGALSAENNSFPTAAVLGQGVLVRKTDGTERTLERILERGLILSEFLPRTHASSFTFPMRNRIISGISTGVLVAEAGKRSGTMITVDCALDQGRDVYAVPCRITEVYNCGTNQMLENGVAHPVYSAEDLLNQLGIAETSAVKKPDLARSIADPNVKKVYELIALGEKSLDELLDLSPFPVEKLTMYLTDLEFSGLIKQLPGRVYTIN